jgi:hypothetical protein
MTLDAFAGDDAQIRPPAGMTGVPGPLLRMIRDQRVTFPIVGATNVPISTAWFVLFLWLLRDAVGYRGSLARAHIVAVLCAFIHPLSPVCVPSDPSYVA